MTELAQKTVLVVDDEPVNISVLSSTLRDHYRVIVAKSGMQALERIEQVTTPDIILLDIIMPEMDGYEVCQILKQRVDTRHIPIIFISAMSDHHDEEKGLSLGATDFIAKPFSPLIVLKRIKNILNLEEAQRSLKDQNKRLEETVYARTKELYLTQNVTIHALASLAETRDSETGNHIRRTQHYVQTLAVDLKAHGYHFCLLHISEPTRPY